jgi:endonuclease YncB( thermonuclease family)
MLKVINISLISLILLLLLNIPCFALEPVKVVSVFDGDTLIVRYHGKDRYVSLQFVSCFEAYTSDKAYKEAYLNYLPVETVVKKGRVAKNYVDNLVKQGDIISIEPAENYGVITARVFLKNGKSLNKLLLDNKKCTY